MHQVPKYPRLAFEPPPGGEMCSITDAFKIAVAAELQGLLRCVGCDGGGAFVFARAVGFLCFGRCRRPWNAGGQG